MRKITLALAGLVLTCGVANAAPDYTAPENSALILQAASAIGVLFYCENTLGFVIPAKADEVAYGRLSKIFTIPEATAAANPLRPLGRLASKLTMIAYESGAWRSVVVKDGRPSPGGSKTMSVAKDCEGPLSYIQVLMEQGGLLDLIGLDELHKG
jgi:hypothetical protein